MGMVVGGNVGITVGLWVGACQVSKMQYEYRGISAWTKHSGHLLPMTPASGAEDVPASGSRLTLEPEYAHVISACLPSEIRGSFLRKYTKREPLNL